MQNLKQQIKKFGNKIWDNGDKRTEAVESQVGDDCRRDIRCVEILHHTGKMATDVKSMQMDWENKLSLKIALDHESKHRRQRE
jgi:hypothetical protein